VTDDEFDHFLRVLGALIKASRKTFSDFAD